MHSIRCWKYGKFTFSNLHTKDNIYPTWVKFHNISKIIVFSLFKLHFDFPFLLYYQKIWREKTQKIVLNCVSWAELHSCTYPNNISYGITLCRLVVHFDRHLDISQYLEKMENNLNFYFWSKTAPTCIQNFVRICLKQWKNTFSGFHDH